MKTFFKVVGIVLLTIVLTLAGSYYWLSKHPEAYVRLYGFAAQKVPISFVLPLVLQDDNLAAYEQIQGKTTDALFEAIQDFDFKIISTERQGNQAKVTIELQSYDLGAAVSVWAVKSVPTFLLYSLQGKDKPQLDEALYGILSEELATLEQDNIQSVPLYVYEDKGLWLIDFEDPRNALFVLALFGDFQLLIDTYQQYE